ncbi:protein RETICULATA-RELATED 3, chloroplastic-like [Senna tora]|uniref:Protein RETICULATA-RELATED 3, chloroplastic-like n=1 Tax=Senna tora TaxID=362788 RepID=A0A835CGF8_9FABA|nr:protein RETICULATA-RELATED 3, chloroplastic-like [Senna tora]
MGFAAGLVGTVLSNGLIAMRKKMDLNFETPHKDKIVDIYFYIL